MKIYGVALLAACFLLGQWLGAWLGIWLNINGNVGGVGFAMALLIMGNTLLRKRGYLSTESESGIVFWSAMYIPVVVAMSATQHVKAALTGGWVAVFAGLAGTAACLMLVPVISKVGRKVDENH
jgi:malonate transporter MadL subunit